MSLYDKYGGFSTVSAIVHDFYERVLESALLAPYFEVVDLARLVSHQTKFFCKVLGGPDNYDGRALAAAHRHMGITAEAFDEVATILSETLEDAGMESEDVAGVMGVVGSVRDQVVIAVAS